MNKNTGKIGAAGAVIAAIFIMHSGSAIGATTLTDIFGHKNAVAIEFLADYKVINGNPDGTFRPDNGINRAELLKMLFEVIGLSVEEPGLQCFPDVAADAWYAKYVCAAKGKGFIQGYADGTFKPAQNVNKVEALKLFALFLEWDLESSQNETIFSDTDAGAWYAPYIKYAKMRNIIQYSGDTYGPGGPMIRGEVAESIFRTAAVYYLEKESYTSGDDATFIAAVSRTEIISPEIATESQATTETEAATETTEATTIFPLITTSTTPTSTTTTTTTAPTTTAPTPSTGTITGACADQSAALNVVRTQLTDKKAEKAALEIFGKSSPLEEGDTFVYFNGYGESDERTLVSGEQQWFFWVDLLPDAMFVHDTMLVTVNTADCYIAKYDSQLWPVINNKAVWSTDIERDATEDLLLRGTDENPQPLFDPTAAAGGAPAAPAEPTFDACNADPDKRRRAIVVYTARDRYPKYSAIDMQKFLCSNDYVTTVITGNNSFSIMTAIENELNAAVAASHANGGFTNFFFFTIGHGFKTGDIIVGDGSVRPADALNITSLTRKMGEIAYAPGGVWSDSFTVVQDSCYSGKVVPKYQAEAYIPPDREGVVGWISTSAPDNTVGWYKRATGKSVYTNALLRCLDNIAPYANMEACIDQEAQKQLPSGKTLDPTLNKLTPITSDAVPLLP